MDRRHNQYCHFVNIPYVKASNNDRSWFQRHLGLPDLFMGFHYLSSELRRYNFGPGSPGYISFNAEMSRIYHDMRKLEQAAFQLDFQRIHSCVPYNSEVQALKLVSCTIFNRIHNMHKMMYREHQSKICFLSWLGTVIRKVERDIEIGTIGSQIENKNAASLLIILIPMLDKRACCEVVSVYRNF
jgi:hypothetical protein